MTNASIAETTALIESLDKLFGFEYSFLESVELLNESVSKKQIKSFIDRINKIVESKPKAGSSAEFVKDFVSKHYDEIIKFCNMMNKEPKYLDKKEFSIQIGLGIGVIVSILSGIIDSAVIGGPIIIFVFWFLNMVIFSIRQAMLQRRLELDKRAIAGLTKIRAILKRLQGRKDIDEDTRNKIFDMIESIDEAKTEMDEYIGSTTVTASPQSTF